MGDESTPRELFDLRAVRVLALEEHVDGLHETRWVALGAVAAVMMMLTVRRVLSEEDGEKVSRPGREHHRAHDRERRGVQSRADIRQSSQAPTDTPAARSEMIS